MNSINTRIIEASKLINKNTTSILDLGCRDKLLKQYISPNIKYQGIDFETSKECLGHNLEYPMPFSNNTFDTVCALDILEHLENIQAAIDDIKRVARNEIIIALPNLYYYRFRFKYLFGNSLGSKYDLPLTKILDRHRWITSYLNSKKLIEYKFSRDNISIIFAKTSNIKIIHLLDKLIQKISPNLGAHTIFFHIKLNKDKYHA